MANNLTADKHGGLTNAIDKITLKGHLVFWMFVLVLVGSIAIDLVVTRVKQETQPGFERGVPTSLPR
jgi:hypothetical protein